MKNKVELYVLLGIILLLSTYIVLRKDRKINYEVPKITSFEQSDISKISFNDLDLTFDNGKWILPSGFFVDSSKIDQITADLSELKVIDMISKSKEYTRFKLDSPDILKVYNGEKLLLQLLVGSTSSTGNYTYIKFPNKDEVYSVRGDLKRNLASGEDELRSKQVLSLDNPTRYTITTPDTTIKKEGEEANDILGYLKNVEAKDFKNLSRTDPLLTIAIEDNDLTKTLIIYNKVDNEYPATSSEVNFPFTIPSWIVTKLQGVKNN